MMFLVMTAVVLVSRVFPFEPSSRRPNALVGTLPVTRRQVVSARYTLALAIIAIVAALMAIVPSQAGLPERLAITGVLTTFPLLNLAVAGPLSARGGLAQLAPWCRHSRQFSSCCSWYSCRRDGSRACFRCSWPHQYLAQVLASVCWRSCSSSVSCSVCDGSRGEIYRKCESDGIASVTSLRKPNRDNRLRCHRRISFPLIGWLLIGQLLVGNPDGYH